MFFLKEREWRYFFSGRFVFPGKHSVVRYFSWLIAALYFKDRANFWTFTQKSPNKSKVDMLKKSPSDGRHRHKTWKVPVWMDFWIDFFFHEHLIIWCCFFVGNFLITLPRSFLQQHSELSNKIGWVRCYYAIRLSGCGCAADGWQWRSYRRTSAVFLWQGEDGTSSTLFFAPKKTARKNTKTLAKLLSRKRPETGMLVGM